MGYDKADWLIYYAEKSVQCDQLIGQLVQEGEVRKKLCALMAKLHEESEKPGHFMPNEAGDRIARARTGAIAADLAEILLGSRERVREAKP